MRNDRKERDLLSFWRTGLAPDFSSGRSIVKSGKDYLPDEAS